MTSVDTPRSYAAWDVPVRLFHWINAICFVGMVVTGLIIEDAKHLGIANDGRILWKELHAGIGYVLTVNLAVRVIWGFMGRPTARWSHSLAFTPRWGRELAAFLAAKRRGEPRAYVGHNPLGAAMVTVLMLTLLAQAGTGLLLAGTDLYAGPFGSWIAHWVAKPGLDAQALIPGNRDMVDAAAWAAMRSFRSPFKEIHEIAFNLSLLLVGLHLAGVIVGEVIERVPLVSAMISGRKILRHPPADLPSV